MRHGVYKQFRLFLCMIPVCVVTNIYSRKDFIAWWFVLKYKNNPKYDVKFVSCRSKFSERTAYFADHAFLVGTYQGVQSEYIDRLRQEQRFYNGQTR